MNSINREFLNWRTIVMAVMLALVFLAGYQYTMSPCARVWAAAECPVGSTATFSSNIGIQAGTVYTGTITHSEAAASFTLSLPTSTDQLVGRATTDTLTNKTYDADGTGNSLINVEDADIKTGAEIDVAKLADGAARQVLQTDAGGTGVEFASNIDIPGTLDVTGAATFDSTLNTGGKFTAGANEVEGSAFDINGGNIDGTVIGAGTPAAATVTTLNTGGKFTAGANEVEGSAFDINGGNIDGTVIGAAVATTGKFTTIEPTTGISNLGGLAGNDWTANSFGMMATASGESQDLFITSDGAYAANQRARLLLRTNQLSTSEPYIDFIIVGGYRMILGMDNSDNDKMGFWDGSSPGSGVPVIVWDPVESKMGILVQPTSGAQVTLGPPGVTAPADSIYSRFLLSYSGSVTIPVGTSSMVSTLRIIEPNITNNGTITKTALLWLDGVATEGDIDYSIYQGGTAINQFDGSIVVGGPTGGSQGNGTINATAVYDDGALLTDYVSDAYLGQLNESRLKELDDLVPDREHKEKKNKTGDVIEESYIEVRDHIPAREFADRGLWVFNPITLGDYFLTNGNLPQLLSETEYVNGDRMSSGEYFQALMELVEILVLQNRDLAKRIEALERR